MTLPKILLICTLNASAMGALFIGLFPILPLKFIMVMVTTIWCVSVLGILVLEAQS